jgi:hypothetical protein
VEIIFRSPFIWTKACGTKIGKKLLPSIVTWAVILEMEEKFENGFLIIFMPLNEL